MQQPAWCLHVHPTRGATGQEAPGLERMHKAPGSGLTSATGPEGGRAGETRHRGGGGVRPHSLLVCLCPETANQAGDWQRLTGRG